MSERHREQAQKQTRIESVKNRGGDAKRARRKLPKFAETCGGITLWCAWVMCSMLVAGYLASVATLLVFGDENNDKVNNPALRTGFLYIIFDFIAVALAVFLPRLCQIWWNNLRQSKTIGNEMNVARMNEKKEAVLAAEADGGIDAQNTPTMRERIGLSGLPTWTDIGLAPVGYIASLLVASWLSWIFEHFSWFNAEEAQDTGFGILVSSTDKILAFVAVAIVGPIAEEIIFRGWLYGRIRFKLTERIPEGWVVAVSSLVTSSVFALVHGQWNVGVTVFALSMVLCGLREITGTIYSGILVHILENGVAFFLVFIAI